MDSSHVATASITAMIATVLVWVSAWPLKPLDLPTASAIAALIVAGAVAGVKLYQAYRPPLAKPAVIVTGPGGLAR